MTIGLHTQYPETTAHQQWHRRKNHLQAEPVAWRPEPAQLYRLIALTLTVHAPLPPSALCERCAHPWPCPQVTLAWRLREGF